MIQQIQIKNQAPAILKDGKLKMLPFTNTREIGDTTYVISTKYSDSTKEDALSKMKRVILSSDESADVTQGQEYAMLNVHTPVCLAEKRKGSEE